MNLVIYYDAKILLLFDLVYTNSNINITLTIE